MKKTTKLTAFVATLLIVMIAAGCDKEQETLAVTTKTPGNITMTSADCGGILIVPQETSPSETGVCWGLELNPNIDGSHLKAADNESDFLCSITDLTPCTRYHVRAYAKIDGVCHYGSDRSFTTISETALTGKMNGHEWVNLGLPSGTLWATCNVGATQPSDYGSYFAWAEISPKADYSWDTYKYCMYRRQSDLTKYCKNNYASYYDSSIHNDRTYKDDLTVLLPEDDAATVNWGNGWGTPSIAQWEELFNNTSHYWILTDEGHAGFVFTSLNGQELFLPFSGYRSGDSFGDVGSDGHYWTKNLYSDESYGAYYGSANQSRCAICYVQRYFGFPIRPVISLSSYFDHPF